MEPRELTIDEFNALNYLVNTNRYVGIIEISSILILRNASFLESFNDIKLTKQAVSYIEDNDDSIAKKIVLIETSTSDGQTTYKATDAAQCYVEYYKNNYLK